MVCKDIKNLHSFHSSKYTRLIFVEGTTISPHSFMWEKVTSDFLIVLKVVRCKLTSDNARNLPSTFFLKHLNLSNNIIHYLDAKLFTKMKNLETLDISRNLLPLLVFDTFRPLPRLEEVVAEFNNISKVVCHLSYSVIPLGRLILRNNHLESLQSILECTSMVPNLQEIDLSFNSFRQLDHHLSFDKLNGLRYLDTTPLSLCCLLSNVKNCQPRQTAKIALCQSLFPSMFFKIFYWLIGIFITLNTLVCLSYLLSQICREKNKHVLWLTFCLLISHWMCGLYFLGLAAVDNFYSPYFSVYEQLWRNSVLCTVFDVLAVAAFQQSLFGSALISVLQLISVTMPFRVSSIQGKPFYISLVLWFFATVVAEGLGTNIKPNRDDFQGVAERSVCLNLLWPGNPRLGWVSGTLLAPGMLTISVFVTNQIVIIYSVRKSASGIAGCETRQGRRFKVAVRAFCRLVIQIAGSMPLFVAHSYYD